ncbi:MAG: T9SS type A sorting domain-containing protein [Chitinophagales bacterium]
MKNLFLLLIAAGLSIGSFAQSTTQRHFCRTYSTKATTAAIAKNSLYRTSAIGSVDTLTHFVTGDSLFLYLAGQNDSGFIAGMDEYEDMGYAERYDFNGNDSTLQVLGVITLFGGVVNPASTKTVNFKVWTVSAPQLIAPNVYNSGVPNTVLTTESVSFLQLGIGGTTAPDTQKIHMFTTPTAYLSDTFFVGFDINYTWAGAAGDTIGLFTTKDGDRTSPIYTLSGADTIVNNVNVSEYSDNTWHDNATDNFVVANNYIMFPIVKVGAGILSVNGIRNKNFIFFGNYPDPAVNIMNIKFSLANTTDVTIEIMDMNGRVINTIRQTNLSAGEHIITLETANLAAGDYLYLIRTTDGGGIASKMTIVK